MDGTQADAPPRKPTITEGEWAGWSYYDGDPFEVLSGPFYARRYDDGRRVCAFRAAKKHMNGGGFMHGGCLATFADLSLFLIAEEALAGSGSVTASLNCEFVDAAREGELIESTGEVVRAGASMVFVRGTVTASGRPVLSFSAILKKVRRR